MAKAFASMACAVLNGADPDSVGTLDPRDFPAFAEVVRDYADTLGLPVPAAYTLDAVTPPTLSQSDEDAIQEAEDYWSRARILDQCGGDVDELD